MKEDKPRFSSVYGEISLANALKDPVFLNSEQNEVLYKELSRLLDLESSMRKVLEAVLKNDPV